MTDVQLKAIQEMLERRTAANTHSEKAAREWILRDGVHTRNGWLARPEAAKADPVEA